MSEQQDDHYLRAVTELGDTQKIVASQDICTQTGMLLVASGIAITSRLYERLVKHVLMKPLDMSVSTENKVDVGSLWGDMQKLLQEQAKLQKVAEIIDKGTSLQQVVLAMPIPAALAFKLTVAREKYPDIYRHSLLIMAMSVYLARCDKMSAEQESHLAMVALFHDIGLLHVNPKLLDLTHVVSVVERRHLYTHPLLAYLLLREFAELPKGVADAVLEHHERMDGRGYPRGLRDGKISRYAQIIGISEVAAKVFDPGAAAWPWRKLEVVLKLNSKQYGKGLIGFLGVLWDAVELDEVPGVANADELIAQIGLVAQLFASFNQHAAGGRGNEIYDFAATRLAELKLGLLGAGFNPNDPDELIRRLEVDPDGRFGYVPLVEEALWQFKALASEIARRWPEEVGQEDTQSRAAEYAWLGMMELLLVEA